MALMACEECGREVSSKAAACPGCGCPVPNGDSMSVGAPSLPAEDRVDDHAPSVRVTLSSPDSLGQAVVTGARAATRSRVWGKLFKTLETLSQVWGVLFTLFAAGLLLTEKSEPVTAAALVFALGMAPPLVLWGLGSWIDWLKK